MILEIILMVITLSAAVVGTYKDDLSGLVKTFLIVLAIAAGIGTLIKSYKDESDKKFMQAALTSTLNPSNSSYEKICNEVDKIGKAAGFDADAECHHSSDGMIGLLSEKAGKDYGIVVLNRQNVSDIYANHIKKSSNQNVINVINEAIHKLYDPKNLNNEEFLDKVGILGFNIYFNIFDEHPLSYNYDPKFGVKIAFDKDGKKQIVQVSPAELKTFEHGKALNLFHLIGKNFREKFQKFQNE